MNEMNFLNLFLSIAFYVFLLTAVTIGAAWWVERRKKQRERKSYKKEKVA